MQIPITMEELYTIILNAEDNCAAWKVLLELIVCDAEPEEVAEVIKKANSVAYQERLVELLKVDIKPIERIEIGGVTYRRED